MPKTEKEVIPIYKWTHSGRYLTAVLYGHDYKHLHDQIVLVEKGKIVSEGEKHE